MAGIRRDEEPKLSEFAFSDYNDFGARRRRVADCLGGQMIVKSGDMGYDDSYIIDTICDTMYNIGGIQNVQMG